MSLIEATIILMALALVTAVVAPSIGDFVEEGRHTKGKEDVEAIGTSLARLLRDSGFPCVTKDTSPSASACTLANRVELLTSSTTVGGNEPAVSATAFDPPDGASSTDTGLNWGGGTSEVDDGYRDLMDNQLVSNTLSGDDYPLTSFSSGSGPRSGLGWRGPYVSGPVGLDPWGYAYQASVIFFVPATNATATTEGETGWNSDVLVISPGPNASIATPFGGTATIAVGDDLTYVVRGATR
jgi:hypothetical protein